MSTNPAIEKLKYPIGRFSKPGFIGPSEIERYINQIESLPVQMKKAVDGITEDELDTPYRPNGWTVRQVIHHVPDSHMNSYIRFKWTLTEDNPSIKAYYEDRWAELPDSKISIDVSLNLLASLHERWVILLKSMNEQDFHRTFQHPEMKHPMRLDTSLALYAWHGEHHLAHINLVKHSASVKP
ncbi:putative metal-dependent hydrolase [Fulvivirgaceae bacterium BMA10]|uniref:Metal-dependent hydrolase n=1 Tax=Splendidivirga corallicola TaxID=3051826 RepID=A0ABT8KKV2_9BACT|nr:putative metal-dependent hydrolase [Fulvivirgaceae bacterium BMA10]